KLQLSFGPNGEGKLERFPGSIHPDRDTFTRPPSPHALRQVLMGTHGLAGDRQDHVPRLNPGLGGVAFHELDPVAAALHGTANPFGKTGRELGGRIDPRRVWPREIAARGAYHTDGQREVLEAGGGEERSDGRGWFVHPLDWSEASGRKFQERHVEG